MFIYDNWAIACKPVAENACFQKSLRVIKKDPAKRLLNCARIHNHEKLPFRAYLTELFGNNFQCSFFCQHTFVFLEAAGVSQQKLKVLKTIEIEQATPANLPVKELDCSIIVKDIKNMPNTSVQ